MSTIKTPHVASPNHADIDSSAYMDPEDLQVADSLHDSIYASTSADPAPSTQPGAQTYNPNQFTRAQSSFNNHLLHNHTDFTDIQTLDTSVPGQDDANWDETSQYRHDFKSYATRYMRECITIGVVNFFAILCIIFAIIAFAIDVLWVAVILVIIAVFFAVTGIYYAVQFWQTYKRRAPFHFQAPWGN